MHRGTTVLCVPDEAALVPAVAALVLAQLNPVLEGFNRSLLLLERRMGELAQELAPRSPEGEREPARDQAPRPGAGSRLEEVQEVRQLLDSHRNAVYEQLNSQHATLQANLGSLRTEVNLKLQRSEEMIQVRHTARHHHHQQQVHKPCGSSMSQ
jgi:uncharacterized protein involved in exopolysaccharide biosynthesis